LNIKKKYRAELDFVQGEIIGWLWFTIGGFHLSPTSVNTSSEKRRGSYFEFK